MRDRPPIDQAEMQELLADIQILVELLMDFNESLSKGATSQQKYQAPIVRRRPPRSQRLGAAVQG